MIRNPVPWPNGARCAACVTFDMDADSLIHIAHPKDGYSRVSAISMLRYGPEVAVPRIVDSYAALMLAAPSISVSIGPGQRALTRMRGANSFAHDRVRPSTACFEAT